MVSSKHKTPCILITIDVEDWFQVENFKPYIPFSTWDARELRVEQNVHRLLDLFDSFSENVSKEKDGIVTDRIGFESENGKIDISQFHPEDEKKRNQVNPAGKSNSKSAIGQNNSKSLPREIHGNESKADFTRVKIQNSKLPCKVKATFFVLGWIAQRLPHMVREVCLRGHEVASHGYNHDHCGTINHNDLKQDLRNSKKLLEDIIGSEIYGYRAPSFSIDNDILKVIEDCGYQYDSSYNSFSLHDRYGKVNLNGNPKNGIAIKLSDNFYELPISNLKLNIPFLSLNRSNNEAFIDSKLQANSINTTNATNTINMSGSDNSKFKIELPWGGGGYFRLIPWPIFKHGMQNIINKDKAIMFYMHPWEIDEYQPRVIEASRFYRFRHYTNIGKAYDKLKSLIEHFNACSFRTCRDHILIGRK